MYLAFDIWALIPSLFVMFSQNDIGSMSEYLRLEPTGECWGKQLAEYNRQLQHHNYDSRLGNVGIFQFK